MDRSPQNLRNVVAAGIIGNSLEVYDYNLYGYYAAIIAALFFSTDSEISGLLATYGIFAAGFIMRPLGALIFGTIGDKWGRKRALELSIFAMAIPTLLIGALPSLYTIGLAAPLLLTLFRLMQGVAVGGELVGSFSFLIEHAPRESRAFIGSWSLVGIFAGKMLAALIVALFAYNFSEEELLNFAWRLPFFAGLIFAYLGYRLRVKVSETPAFNEMKKNGRAGGLAIRKILSLYKRQILQLIFLTASHTVSVYLLYIYMPIYLATTAGLPYLFAIASTTLSLILTALALPIGGLLADRFGRKPILFFGNILLLAAAYPCFLILQSGGFAAIIAAQALLSLLFSLMHAPMPATYVELFPTNVRYTATAIAYNVSTTFFGGFTPLICTSLIAFTGSGLSPLYWFLATGIISTLAAFTLPETQGKPLEKFAF